MAHVYIVMLAVGTQRTHGPVLCTSMNAFFAANQLTTVTLEWPPEKVRVCVCVCVYVFLTNKHI